MKTADKLGLSTDRHKWLDNQEDCARVINNGIKQDKNYAKLGAKLFMPMRSDRVK